MGSAAGHPMPGRFLPHGQDRRWADRKDEHVLADAIVQGPAPVLTCQRDGKITGAIGPMEIMPDSQGVARLLPAPANRDRRRIRPTLPLRRANAGFRDQ
jgi:hypothetical protein